MSESKDMPPIEGLDSAAPASAETRPPDGLETATEAPPAPSGAPSRLVTSLPTSRKIRRLQGEKMGEEIEGSMASLADQPSADNGHGPGGKEYILIGGVKYLLTPYSFRDVEEASGLIAQLPLGFFAAAIIRPNDPMESITLEELRDMANRFLPEEQRLNDEGAAALVPTFFSNITPDVLEVMLQICVLNFGRWAKEEGYTLDPETPKGQNNIEEIRNYLDFYTFPLLLRKIYLKNLGTFGRFITF